MKLFFLFIPFCFQVHVVGPRQRFVKTYVASPFTKASSPEIPLYTAGSFCIIKHGNADI